MAEKQRAVADIIAAWLRDNDLNAQRFIWIDPASDLLLHLEVEGYEITSKQKGTHVVEEN